MEQRGRFSMVMQMMVNFRLKIPYHVANKWISDFDSQQDRQNWDNVLLMQLLCINERLMENYKE